MHLTPLNIFLGGALLSLCVALLTHVLTKISYVTRREFDEFKRDVKRDNRILFRMVRALVIYSNIPKADQEDILNERGDDKC